MFRPMRRSRQQLSPEECEEILRTAASGVLAVTGDEGWPYAVPLSYVYHQGAVYFHCARTGHKLDAIKQENRVSFCVVAQDEIVPEEYTTYYRSVILFGRAEILEALEDIRAAIEILAKKYHPADTTEHRNHMIDREIAGMCMVKITPEHISGKEAIELRKQRS